MEKDQKSFFRSNLGGTADGYMFSGAATAYSGNGDICKFHGYEHVSGSCK